MAGLAALVLAAPTTGCGTDAPAETARGPRVTHVRLEGEIDVGALALVTRGVRQARRDGTECLLVDLDTRGGGLEEVTQIQGQLNGAHADGLSIACWVHDRALSAGVLIALSARSTYMTASATIGSAHPVLMGPDGKLELPEDPVVLEKLTSAVRAQFRAQAEATKRPPSLAQAMVEPRVEVQQVRIDNELRLVADEDWDSLRASATPYEVVRTVDGRDKILNLSAQEAVELRFADGIANKLDDVLVRLGYAAGDASPVLERSASDRAVAWIERLTPLLILAALVLGYLELKLPGFGLPGILSAACFLAVVGGKYLAGIADVPHIVAVALGLALLVLEVLVLPGTLWFGIAGGMLLAGGLILASIGPSWSWTDAGLWERLLDTGLEYAIVAVLAIVVALAITRFLPNTPVLRRAVLVPDPAGAFGGGVPEAAVLPSLGARGTALTDLRPVGKVEMDGQRGLELEARSLGPFLAAGARVRVVEVGAGRLVVEREPGERA